MAVVNVTKKWSGRTVSLSKDRRSYSEGYQVLLDSPTDAPLLAATASDIPVDGASLSLDPWARLRRKEVRELGPLLFEVACIYETAPKSGATPGVDPLSEPPKVSIATQRIREAVEIDLDGRLCANSAGVLYDPPPEVDFDDVMMVVTRNYGSIDTQLLMSYRNAVNSDVFFAQPGQAKMDSIEAVRIFEGDLLYFTVTFRIIFREGLPAATQANGGDTTIPTEIGGPSRAWWTRVANVGLDEWIAGGADQPRVYRRITDAMGMPVSGPVALGPFGYRLPANKPALVQEFRFRPSKPFAVLNIL